MRIFKALAVFFVFLSFLPRAHGEVVQDRRTWFVFIAQGPFADKSPWRWYVDAQDRQRDGVEAIDQFVTHSGIGYALTKQSTVWVGYTYSASFPTKGPRIDENRAWEQYLWIGPVASGTFSSRTRLEQRFIEEAYDSRIREQVRFSRPIHGSSVSFLVWNEIFFNFNTTPYTLSGFDQNRAFAGVSIRVNPKSKVDLGYLNQFNRATGPDKMHNILYVGYAVNF